MVGNFSIIDPVRTYLSDNPGTLPDYVKHTSAGTDEGVPNQAPGWSVDWVAPSGTLPNVTFYIAAVAANDAQGPDGDYVYTFSLSSSASSPSSSLLPVYRFWSNFYGSHHYTISEWEKNYIISTWPDYWIFEGVAFYAYPAQ